MNEKILETLIKNIEKLRIRHGCTCKQLSELIGCDASYISKVENGRLLPSVDKIILIANYFQIKFTDLFEE